MRRLPVYFLIDTSGSMKGEPIASVNEGIASMLATLKRDPFSLETVNICIITFDREVKCLCPLTPLEELILPEITTPESGPTHTGAALSKLCELVDKDVRQTTENQKGDWMPLLFLMTDGKPSDIQLYQQMVQEVKKRSFGAIVACAAGPAAQTGPLKLLTDRVFSLDVVDSNSFMQFFKWVSDTIGTGNRSVGATEELVLPPPPEEINVII